MDQPYANAVRRHLLGLSRGRAQRSLDRAVFRRLSPWGEAFDRLEVPFYALRWVASAEGAELERRARVVLELAERGWSWRDFVLCGDVVF